MSVTLYLAQAKVINISFKPQTLIKLKISFTRLFVTLSPRMNVNTSIKTWEMETDFSSQRLCSCVLRIWWKISFTTLFVWTLFYVFLFCRVVKQCLTFALNCSAINRQTNRAFSDIWCLSPELCHAPDPELWCDFQPIRRQCERLLTNQKPNSIRYKIQVSPKWDIVTGDLSPSGFLEIFQSKYFTHHFILR